MYALKHTCMQMYAYMYAFFTRTLPVARVVLGCLPVLPGMTAVPGLSLQQEARRRACGPITISHDHAHRIDCQPWGFGGRSHHGQPREPRLCMPTLNSSPPKANSGGAGNVSSAQRSQVGRRQPELRITWQSVEHAQRKRGIHSQR